MSALFLKGEGKQSAVNISTWSIVRQCVRSKDTLKGISVIVPVNIEMRAL